MFDGRPFTVIDLVTLQPVGSVYVIVVLPVAAPLTMPLASIVAVPGALLLQPPPPVLLSSVIV
jgi:hypothetical protein